MTKKNSNTLPNSKDATSKWTGAASITSLSSGKCSTSKPPQPRSGLNNSRWATTSAQDNSANDTRSGKTKGGQQMLAPVPDAPASQQKGAPSKWTNAASVTSLDTGKRANLRGGLQNSRFAAAPVEAKPAISTAATPQADSKQNDDEPERSPGLKLLAEMNRKNREKLLGSAKNGSLQLLNSQWADPEVKEKKSEDYKKMLEEEEKKKKDAP